MLGPLKFPTVQVHPLLRCNLRCVHCYSSSGPAAKAELTVGSVCDAISDAFEMGYQVVSISGGEPLLYRGLHAVLGHSKALGMQTTVTTNGYFLNPERLEQLKGCLDLLAVSIDGPPEVHNSIRGSGHAFERLLVGLKHARSAALDFGVIHTLTRQTWEHLLWVAEFAAEHGASLLQIHPLESAGRAASTMGGAMLDEETLAKAYLLTVAIANRYRDVMMVQLDLLHRDDLLRTPELGYASQDTGEADSVCPAHLLSLIVLEPDGSTVPISYGFSREFEICNVTRQRLADAWVPFVRSRYVPFRRLCKEVFDEVCTPTGPALFNWHELMVARSRLAEGASTTSGPWPTRRVSNT